MRNGILRISWLFLFLLTGVICTLIYTWRLDLLQHHFNELFVSVFTLAFFLYHLVKTKQNNKNLQIQIRKQEQLQEELSDSNELMKYVIEHNSSGIAVHDQELRYIYVSQKYIDEYGIKERNIIGKHHYEVFPNLPQKWRDAHQKALAGEVTVADEDPYIRDDGSLEYTRWECRPWYKVNNNLGGIIVYTSVITDNVIARQKLRERDLRYVSLYENNKINALIFDKETLNIIDANSAACEFYGWPREELIRKKVSDISATPHEEVLAEIRRMRQEGKNHFHIQQRLANGEIRDVEIFEGELSLQGQNLLYIMILDITERKKMEKALRESREKNEALLKAHPDLMFLITREGQLEEIYAEETPSLFITVNDMGKNIFDFVPKNITPLFQKHLKQLFSTGKKQQFRYPIQIKDNEKYYINRIVKVGEEKALMTITNITATIETERELIRAKEKAEESDRLKSAFLANMSHEIRTPMNGIIGFAELLKDPGITPKERAEYIEIIDQSGHRLLNIINDIVEISKIEAGIIQKKITAININEHLDYIGRFFRLEIEKKEMNLKIRPVNLKEEAIVKSDSEKLYAVLINLVKNAIKYSEIGTIEVGCTKNRTHFEFYVKDTGYGISEEKQKEIFDRFVRAENDKRRIIEGTGLGLSIAKAYVELLGGTIWVKSKLNEGSIFYFTIPIEKYVEPSAEEKDEKNDEIFQLYGQKQLKILVADDDEMSLKLLSRYLEPYSAELFYAKNGLEAVETFKNKPGIDLILMDVQMPVMNGYEATQEIRKFNREVIIISQTAYALSEDKKMAQEAGCSAYVSKPVNRQVLEKIIARFFALKNGELR